MHITEDLLTVNEFSHPGRKLAEVLAIIFHWTGNPGVSAKANRDYFESLKSGPTYASAHYVIGLGGEIIHCIPDNEVAYHVGSSQPDPASERIYTDWARSMFGAYASNPTGNSPNNCTIGVELCPIDSDGNFTPATLDSAADLGAVLCFTHDLDPLKQVGTHHLTVGWKDCPMLWTRRPALLEAFRSEVKERMG